MRAAFLLILTLTACVPREAPLALAEPEPEAPSCSVDQIGVDRLHGQENRHDLVITGILQNGCPMPIGVEVKFTLYAQDGRVLLSRDYWPASVGNIPANGTFPFEIPFEKVAGFHRYEVAVLSVKQW